MSTITKEEFIKTYCERSNISWETLSQRCIVVSCDCDYEGCQGWGMVSKSLQEDMEHASLN